MQSFGSFKKLRPKKYKEVSSGSPDTPGFRRGKKNKTLVYIEARNHFQIRHFYDFKD